MLLILSGKATMEVDGEIRVLHGDEAIEVAPGFAHQIRNISSEPLAFLVISQPASHIDRVLADSVVTPSGLQGRRA
jgi:mannose-6-phosphate isomerase-like protein (cupin superfamily)